LKRRARQVQLAFLITADQVPGKRLPGSLRWGGINNTHFWIDPNRGLAGVILMQYLPFADEKALAVYDAFERACISWWRCIGDARPSWPADLPARTQGGLRNVFRRLAGAADCTKEYPWVAGGSQEDSNVAGNAIAASMAAISRSRDCVASNWLLAAAKNQIHKEG
jgi:CubicO group peptidase (beta-lactamase class C family)